MTETQVCLLSMSSVTDCQSGGVVEFEEEGREKEGRAKLKKATEKEKILLPGEGKGVGITGNYGKGAN